MTGCIKSFFECWITCNRPRSCHEEKAVTSISSAGCQQSGDPTQPPLRFMATQSESAATQPWSTMFGADEDEDEDKHLAEQRQMQQIQQMLAAAPGRAQLHAKELEDLEEVKRLEEAFFVKICAREQAWTPRSHERVRKQATRTAHRYWQAVNKRLPPGVNETACCDASEPSPLDYVEAPRPAPDVSAYERRFAVFEQRAKAKETIKFSDVPWPDAEMFAACLMKSQNEEHLRKTSKQWARRWHPDSWSRYNLDPTDREKLEETVLKVSMMIQAQRQNSMTV